MHGSPLMMFHVKTYRSRIKSNRSCTRLLAIYREQSPRLAEQFLANVLGSFLLHTVDSQIDVSGHGRAIASPLRRHWLAHYYGVLLQ